MSVLVARNDLAVQPQALLRAIPGLLVIAAVCFNAVLAVINAHVMPLSSAQVIACELVLVAAAHVVAIAHYRPAMLPWYVLAGLLVLFACWRAAMLQQVEPKYLRDVLIIPTFVVLGMTFDHRHLVRVVVAIHLVVVAGLVFEAVDTPGFVALFRVEDYYIQTRGYDFRSFWNTSSDLFVSATRPDSRLFSFLDMHRLSSVFLEPVSLGNYCVVIVAFLCAWFDRLSWPVRIFLAAGTIVAVIGCDGRLAAAASVLIIAAALVACRLPRASAVLYLPAVTLVAILLVTLAGLRAGPDDFPGRIAHMVELAGRFGPAEFAGISGNQMLLSESVDSGLDYLVLTQSVLGVTVLWLFLAFGAPERRADQIRFKHASLIYLALTMVVSFAFLSIKTAALLWFVQGVLATDHPPSRAAGLRDGGETF